MLNNELILSTSVFEMVLIRRQFLEHISSYDIALRNIVFLSRYYVSVAFDNIRAFPWHIF